MVERIKVPCVHCGDEIPFEVESWAKPPKRAFCDEGCHKAHTQAATPNPTATA